MKKIVNKLISKVKGENYLIDDSISTIDIIKILFIRFKMLIRGFFKKILLKQKPKYLFVGSNTKIHFKNKIKMNGTVTIGNNCIINALSKRGIELGSNFKLGDFSIIECTGVIRDLGEGLIIGNNVGISANSFIGVRGQIIIGDDTIIGPYFNIHSENHNYNGRENIKNQGEKRLGVKIGKNCWIGSNVTILDGVKLGDGCVVGAGSVVTKSFPENCVIVGVPGKVIKRRNINEDKD